ncbi:hypothetical protein CAUPRSCDRAFT_11429 [Caulochytrium protostelioides]|uniref:Uncharacterized protein n=1 Tax=Caulochytrium protostelioides TaxID=1555241 RepID=A0A4P9WX31_9FUNG|nr:hypothetical protein CAUPRSCDRAFT_11429 [Caulochytrium protostelioides]
MGVSGAAFPVVGAPVGRSSPDSHHLPRCHKHVREGVTPSPAMQYRRRLAAPLTPVLVNSRISRQEDRFVTSPFISLSLILPLFLAISGPVEGILTLRRMFIATGYFGGPHIWTIPISQIVPAALAALPLRSVERLGDGGMAAGGMAAGAPLVHGIHHIAIATTTRGDPFYSMTRSARGPTGRFETTRPRLRRRLRHWPPTSRCGAPTTVSREEPHDALAAPPNDRRPQEWVIRSASIATGTNQRFLIDPAFNDLGSVFTSDDP